jgi:catecholate siderophore receptor
MKMVFKIRTSSSQKGAAHKLFMNQTAAVIALIFLCALLTSGQTVALETYLTGSVCDPNHAAVHGAEVTVMSTALSRTVRTDEHGSFMISLPHGDYIVRATATGFEVTTTRVRLTEYASASIEIILPVAGSTEVVTIVAADGVGYQADAINSATKTLTALRDTPQSITVIPTERLRDQSMTSISDVLNYVPGVTSHQGENNRDQVVIRGVSSSADFFLNGVRDDVQYYRDLYNVNRVEILKGPNAMIFGRGGGGGVINRVSKEPQSSPAREFTIQGGSFSDRRFTGDFNQPIGRNVAMRFNALYEGAESFRQFVNRRRYGVNPTITISPGTNTHINVGYEHFYDSRTADRGIPSFMGKPADSPIETYFGNPNDAYARARVNLLTGTVEHGHGRLNIRNRTMLGEYDRAYQNYVLGTVNTVKTLIVLTAYNNSTKRQNRFNQSDLTFYVSTGSVKHMFLAGAEFGRQLTDNVRNTGFFNNISTTVQVPFADPVIATPVTFRQSATDANNHLKTNLAATYVQDQVEISKQLQVVAGVRFDCFDLHFHNNRNGDNLRRVDRLMSPRLGVVYKPLPAISLYATHSVSYLPSSGDQFSSLTVVTQQVKPEEFRNYEVGMKWDARRNLSLNAAMYRQDRTNTRATDPNDPTRILQTGKQRTSGFEAEVSGALTRAWMLAGGYAYQDARITNATTAAPMGAIVPLVPHHTFTLWSKYQVISRVGLGLGVAHRSDAFAAIDNKVTLPGYTKVDAAAYFRLAEKWKVQAHFDNWLNVKYYLNADGNNNISPGAPRSVKVSLIAAF